MFQACDQSSTSTLSCHNIVSWPQTGCWLIWTHGFLDCRHIVLPCVLPGMSPSGQPLCMLSVTTHDGQDTTSEILISFPELLAWTRNV